MTATVELFLLFLLVLALVTKPMGRWMTPMCEGKAPAPIARLDGVLLKCLGLREDAEQSWAGYALSLFLFNALGCLFLYGILRLQGVLPWNPMGFAGMPADQALNTAISFVTNTNWQSYGGEASLSPLSQAVGLTVQNFVSAGTGIAVAFVVIRSFARSETKNLGNFWVDMVRINLWLLLPIAFIFALVLIGEGSVQTWSAAQAFQSVTGQDGSIALGPVASQEAIKMLGTNGGGFFNVNSAHPFENPTALTNFLQCLAICAMAVLFTGALLTLAWFEYDGANFLTHYGAAESAMHMEGKEMRFPLSQSSLFSVVTTSASCGAVNNMHDSLTPIGGLVPMLLMLLGEVVFGGVGAGFYGMMIFIIIAVFVAGLMVGRTPEYLGKKIDVPVMKLASIGMLVTPVIVLVGLGISSMGDFGTASITNPGPHGFSQMIYAWASAANNNGSAFAGFGANTPWYNLSLGAAMWFGRFFVILAMLALAGALVRGRRVPSSDGTLVTHGMLFCGLLVGTVLLVGALTYFPLLALGPVAEYVSLP